MSRKNSSEQNTEKVSLSKFPTQMILRYGIVYTKEYLYRKIGAYNSIDSGCRIFLCVNMNE